MKHDDALRTLCVCGHQLGGHRWHRDYPEPLRPCEEDCSCEDFARAAPPSSSDGEGLREWMLAGVQGADGVVVRVVGSAPQLRYSEQVRVRELPAGETGHVAPASEETGDKPWSWPHREVRELMDELMDAGRALDAATDQAGRRLREIYDSGHRLANEIMRAKPSPAGESEDKDWRCGAGAPEGESAEPGDDRCAACGVSKQQVLGKHEEVADLVRRAAPFVNAVAAMADDKTNALTWLADAAVFVGPPAPGEAPSEPGDGARS